MNSSIDEFYADIYKLAYITRYAGVPRVKNESVAEHSFFVASLVIKLHQTYAFDVGRALKMAITHDWAECAIGDVTWAVKQNFSVIRDAMHLAEHETIVNKFGAIYDCWLDYVEQSCIEAKVVTLADVMQVAQYAENEVKLGNVGYMTDVANSAYLRIEQLKEALNEHKRQ